MTAKLENVNLKMTPCYSEFMQLLIENAVVFVQVFSDFSDFVLRFLYRRMPDVSFGAGREIFTASLPKSRLTADSGGVNGGKSMV